VVQPLHIQHAQVWNGREVVQRDLFTSADGRITHQAANGALVVDLDGYTIFPGLINAHDHLELNHYPRSKFRERYDNAHQWGEDMNARLDSEPYKSLRAYPLEDRLLVGGLKNLLCGATTVAHHGTPHKPLFRSDFPVRVLRKYGWAHSLHFDTDEDIVRSYRRTRKDWPWFIHLAEGTDSVAAGEYQRLKALGCIQPNTVLVHGVGITPEDVVDAQVARHIQLIWCPSTNLYLLNQTLDDGHWFVVHAGSQAIGSDSRLTADGDLLDELRTASGIFNHECLDFVTMDAAHALRQDDVGHLKVHAQGDWIVLAHRKGNQPHLKDAKRADLALVVLAGIPQIGDPDMMARFPHIETVPATLDGKPKAIRRGLAERIWTCTLKEPGLQIAEPPKRQRFFLPHKRHEA
jgi:cytosine/adenosine deaminase-related metal-dependent hydrolase